VYSDLLTKVLSLNFVNEKKILLKEKTMPEVIKTNFLTRITRGCIRWFLHTMT